ncbi:hypothetical protein [Campylobacter coli]|uniref:hypothetical protein n=1 Tax=Campylobacter coli TaxID=195 RepID=UPI000A9D81F8|nr:hypothetical protein [Campylobacter coli]
MSKKLSVVCIGNCDLYPTYGFVGGLKEAGVKVISYSESWNTIHSLLYHIERIENQDVIHSADLIVLGIGGGSNDKNLVSLYKILYKKLWKLNKKVLVCIWNHVGFESELEYLHHMQCETYGFNLIDVRKYCKEKEIFAFYTSYHDFGHPFYSFMSGISKRIIKEFDKLQYPKQLNSVNDKADFKIVPFAEFVDKERIKKTRTFTHYENIYKLENNQEIQIPPKYQNYTLIGIHMMNGSVNSFTAPKTITTFVLKNKTKKALVHAGKFNYIIPININNFVIDNETYLQRIFDNMIEKLKPVFNTDTIDKNANLGLIALLLIKDNNCLEDQEINYDENFKLSSKYDFTYILDFLIEGKKFIEDYNKRQDPIKLIPLQKQIQEKDKIINSLTQEKQKLEQDYKAQIQILNNKTDELQNRLKSPQVKKENLELLILDQDLFNKKLEGQKLAKSLGIKTNTMDSEITFIQVNSAKARIQNHLSYKIGQVLIQNSKSLWGYIRMPFILSYIKDKHNKEQSIYKVKMKENPNLALPPLESYPDYKEALKEKKCFTYKLGESFIQAHNNWYKGGYISFYFKDMPRLRREKLKKEKI